MLWYEGEITGAIQKAISEKKLFIVFVRDESEQSEKMKSFWEIEEIQSLCSAEVCVAIDITVDSVAGQQFGSIYPILCVPSTFLINNDGIPSAILPSMEKEEFVIKLKEVFENFKSSLSANVSSQETDEQEVDEQTDEQVESTNQEDADTAASEETSTQPLSGKEKAEMLVEKARANKARKEKEETKEKERKRREEGRELSQAKRDVAERQAKQLADEVAKRRAEEKAAREKVRQQIKQDREDKLAKYDSEKKTREKIFQQKVEDKEAAAVAAKKERMDSNVTRIQFRLPDGSTTSKQFQSDAMFLVVNDYVTKELASHLPNIRLTTVYPKHEYTSEDCLKSLRELGLTPNASIIVSPGRSQSSPSSSSLNPLSIIMMILAPFFAIFSWIISIFSSSPNSNNETKTTAQHQQQQEPNQTVAPNNPRNATVRQRNLDDKPRTGSNIRRLYDDKPDDDENATWNGNSTQQM